MSRLDTLTQSARGAEGYSPACLGYNGTEHEEPELIKQMKEAGLNHYAQESYLRILPHQEGLSGKRRLNVLIGNIGHGIDYLSSLGKSTKKLERMLQELSGVSHIQFQSKNGTPPEPRNPATKNLRTSQYGR